MRHCRLWLLLVLALVLPASAHAIDPLRSWTELVTSNGYTGVVLDLADGEVHHFREHIYASEEPRWREDNGEELWLPTVPGGDCFKPQYVASRDLLRDAYFGARIGERALWLRDLPVDLDASGYDGVPSREGRDGGTGILRMVQRDGALTFTTRVFAPWSLEASQFVMLLEVHNGGSTAVESLALHGLVNTALGHGRPGPRQETGADFETIRVLDDGAGVLEQGFAGLIYLKPLVPADVLTHTPAPFYDAVQSGSGELPVPETTPVSGDDLAAAMQWNVGALAPGERTWVGLVVAHDPNPDRVDGRIAEVDAWVDGRTPEALWQAERADWDAFQARLTVPAGLSTEEADLLHHSATVLRMAQVRESSYWLRPQVDRDVVRTTGIDGDARPVSGTGEVREHLGAGAVLASLPPGEWAYAWVRDGAYAIVGLVDGGLYDEARAALEFYLRAEANRYVNYEELRDVPLRDYAISLTRYHGFGIEESDTLCNGDLNFEWDGFGLFLWSLRHYVEETGDTALVEAYWPTIRDRIARVIEDLVVDNGLLWPDSSIWEVHWFGKEKQFAYTSITAARGMCDAAWMASAMGESAIADEFERSGRQIRQAIWRNLRAPGGEIAANVEELATGTGYWDAAAIEAVAMGLFDPAGPTAQATIQAIRDRLTVPHGRGLQRNDDEFDGHLLTPYGSFYDSQEWVVIDYRMSIAARHAGNPEYADALQEWVRDQSLLNFLLIGENYDENTGEYRNNAPMIGFGSGSYLTAMRQRAGDWSVDAACGVYFEADPLFGPDEVVEPVDPSPDAGPDAGSDAGVDAEGDVGSDADATTDDAATDADDDAAADTETPDAETPDAETPDAETPDTSPSADTTESDTVGSDDAPSPDEDTPRADASGGDEPDAAESPSDDEAPSVGGGGCAASGSGSRGSGALFLLALVGLRRSRGSTHCV